MIRAARPETPRSLAHSRFSVDLGNLGRCAMRFPWSGVWRDHIRHQDLKTETRSSWRSRATASLVRASFGPKPPDPPVTTSIDVARRSIPDRGRAGRSR